MVVAPAPAPVSPASVAVPAPVAVPVVPAGPRIDEVSVTVGGASKTTLKCGGLVGSGAASARLTRVPAGMCTIEVEIGGETHRMGFGVEAPTALSCALTEGVLRCS